MLFDLEQRKPEAERDYDNFDPNDEILVRIFVIPELLDALRHGRFDTAQGTKTENILLLGLGLHLQAEAAHLTELVFEELIVMYETLSSKFTDNWWRHIPDEYKEENRPMLEKSERALVDQLNQWRGLRAANRAE
jgi:hypothetical protein